MMKAGTIYFYIASILNWIPVLSDDIRKNIILDSLKFLVNNGAVKLYAFVIMPNHIHLLWKPIANEKVKNVQLSFMKFSAQQILFQLMPLLVL
jgi:putative transposase